MIRAGARAAWRYALLGETAHMLTRHYKFEFLEPDELGVALGARRSAVDRCSAAAHVASTDATSCGRF
jgi:hypothetical protein